MGAAFYPQNPLAGPFRHTCRADQPSRALAPGRDPKLENQQCANPCTSDTCPALFAAGVPAGSVAISASAAVAVAIERRESMCCFPALLPALGTYGSPGGKGCHEHGRWISCHR